MTIHRLRRTIKFTAALAALLAITPSVGLKAQTITDTLNCGRNSTIDMGAVITGGTLTNSLLLFDSSRTDSVFSITSSVNSGFLWPADSTTNISIQPLQVGYATTLSFSADSIAKTYSDQLVFESKQDSSCITTFTLTAEVVGPDSNNSTIPLNHTSHNIIAFKSDTSDETLDLQFQNNGSKSISIDTLELQSDSAFRIVSSSIKFPASLSSGSFFNLRLSFIARSPGFHSDFISAPNHSILPLSVQGLLLPNDAVKTQPFGTIYFYLYPNPSTGPVTIHTENITQAHVTITDVLGRTLTDASFTDVLGRTLTDASFTGDWQWDRIGWSGIVPSGTYFVVVTGFGSNGEPVHEVKRLVLE